MSGENCFLPGKEGEQLPGNCYLPEKEGEQWPERRELSLFEGDLDLLLPQEEGEVLPGGFTAFPGEKGGTCLPVWIITCPGKIVITVIVRRPSYISFLFVYQVLELFNLPKFDFVQPNFTYLVNEALAFPKSVC